MKNNKNKILVLGIMAAMITSGALSVSADEQESSYAETVTTVSQIPESDVSTDTESKQDSLAETTSALTTAGSQTETTSSKIEIEEGNAFINQNDSVSGDYEYKTDKNNNVIITRYTADAENVVIPEKIDGKTVTEIGENAFSYKNLKNVTIPKTVNKIGFSAFGFCKGLTSVSIPSNVLTIDSSFNDCINLENVNLSEGIKTVTAGSFLNCSKLKHITIPASITTIGRDAFGFEWKNGKEVKVNGFNITCTKGSAGEGYAVANGFEYNYKDGTAPSDSKELTSGDYTYKVDKNNNAVITKYNKNADNVVIPEKIDGKTVTEIGENAFSHKNIKSVTIPQTVNKIGFSAFGFCTGLKSVSIPGTVLTIDSSFNDCTALESVTLAEGIKTVTAGSFVNCIRLKNITIPASITTIGRDAFGFQWKNGKEVKVDGFKITCTKGSDGEGYAVANGFEYKYTDGTAPAVPETTTVSSATVTSASGTSAKTVSTASTKTTVKDTSGFKNPKTGLAAIGGTGLLTLIAGAFVTLKKKK